MMKYVTPHLLRQSAHTNDSFNNPDRISQFSESSNNLRITTSNLLDELPPRPSTAFRKMVEKFGNLGIQATFQNGEFHRKKKVPLAKTLGAKLVKLIASEEKLLRLQKSLSKEMKEWAVGLSSLGSQAMIKEFGNLYSNHIAFNGALNEKYDRIRIALNDVSKREEQFNVSVDQRNEQLKVLKDIEVKHGKNSSNSTEANENIERLDLHIVVLRQQCTRAIGKELKASFMDYLISSQIGTRAISEASQGFLQVAANIDWDTDAGGSKDPFKLEAREDTCNCPRNKYGEFISICPHELKSFKANNEVKATRENFRKPSVKVDHIQRIPGSENADDFRPEVSKFAPPFQNNEHWGFN